MLCPDIIFHWGRQNVSLRFFQIECLTLGNNVAERHKILICRYYNENLSMDSKETLHGVDQQSKFPPWSGQIIFCYGGKQFLFIIQIQSIMGKFSLLFITSWGHCLCPILTITVHTCAHHTRSQHITSQWSSSGRWGRPALPEGSPDSTRSYYPMVSSSCL